MSKPDGIGNRRAYSFIDTTVLATHKYRYRLDGKFSIEFRGEEHDYVFASQEVSATAAVPVGGASFRIRFPIRRGTASCSR